MHHPPLAVALATLCALAGCSPALPSAAPGGRPVRLQAAATPGRILVAYDRARQGVQALERRLGLSAVSRIPQLGIAVVRASGDPAAALARLRAEPGVRFAEPDVIERLPLPVPGALPALQPRVGAGDPMLDQQWALRTANVQAAWGVTRGRRETVVAIVDTGVDLSHPDLADHLLPGRDLVNQDDEPQDDNSHGTHCAGIVAATADNGVGIAGVAPGVSLLPVKVMDAQGAGSVATICEGIVWAADHGADVINLSIGGLGGPEAKQAAVDYARAKGVVVVAAMGNDGKFHAVYPAASKGVIAVGATTAEDTRASFSNMGVWMAVSAPGHKIVSTILRGSYWPMSGTSMAAPHVAGLAALLRSARPALTVDEVTERIRKGAKDLGKPGYDDEFGQGRVDFGRTLEGL